MVAVPAELISSLAAPRPSQTVYREECTQCFDTHDLPAGIDVCLHCFNGACPPPLNGVESANGHGRLHFDKTGHRVVVNIQRRKKPQNEMKRTKRDSNEPPIKKLAIREEQPEEDKFDFYTQVRMYDGDRSTAKYVVVDEVDDKLNGLVAAVLSSMSSAQKSEVKAWEEEIVPCSHTRELVQPEPKKLEPAGLASCAVDGCGLTSNLWLCLVCGALGCGRQQFGGGGGNGHALEHTSTTGHAVAVKLGTIEPDGSADVYCYACDDARVDPDIAQHLSTFGIEVATQKKTEKSMTELQVEQNLTFDFAMTGADGKELEPLFGPGLTGLRNLGNSCYMASSLQSLFSLPAFQDRYLTSFVVHPSTCTNPSPATCFECQMSKVADGLLSGRYAVPHVPEPSDALAGYDLETEKDDKPRVQFQEGIKPSMFKALVGKDHAEFSTMRQQDAGEFVAHLLEFVRRAAKQLGTDEPTGIFGFAVEERLQCGECHGVRYKTQAQELLPVPVPVKKREAMDVEAAPGTAAAGEDARTTYEQDKDRKVEYEPVELTSCLDSFTSPTEIEYSCPRCEQKVSATKSTRFATFPDVLLVNAARFQLDNWVPRKVDVPLIVPATRLDMSPFVGTGLQESETELPKDKEDAPAEPTFDADAMNQLAGMGFPEIRCKRALIATGHNGAEVAMNWLFEHMEDPDIDDPLPAAAAAGGVSSGAGEPSEGDVAMVCEMGFSPAQARKALRETGGSMERAVEWLFSHPDDDGSDSAPAAGSSSSAGGEKPLPGSKDLPARYRLKAFISHKGPSVHSGHYVAHVWTGQADQSGGGKGGWVLFNDEKVVRADEGEQAAEKLMPLAYVYLFERVRE
ncbi:ubiquitin C-terminal hydrolase Ubp14 [Rhodotorula kratochvilovae]